MKLYKPKRWVVYFMVAAFLVGGGGLLLLKIFQNKMTHPGRFAAIWNIITDKDYFSVCDDRLRKHYQKLKEMNLEELSQLEKACSYYASFINNRVLVPLHTDNNGAYIGDIDQDGRQELVTWGDSYDFRGRGSSVIEEYAAVRILRVQQGCLKLLFRQSNLGGLVKVLIQDLNKDGRKEVVCNWESGGSAGYGETTIIFSEGGLFKFYNTEKLSWYCAKAANLAGDRGVVILVRYKYPPEYYHMGEVHFPVPYQWAKGTLVVAPLDIRKVYFNRAYIPEMQKEIKSPDRYENLYTKSWNTVRREAIRFAQRMTKEPVEQVLKDIY